MGKGLGVDRRLMNMMLTPMNYILFVDKTVSTEISSTRHFVGSYFVDSSFPQQLIFRLRCDVILLSFVLMLLYLFINNGAG